jgi:hypothetical protein
METQVLPYEYNPIVLSHEVQLLVKMEQVRQVGEQG